MHKKIMITGANGLLGRWLVQVFGDNDLEIIAIGKGSNRNLNLPKNCTYFSLNLTDGIAVDEFINTQKPTYIIHAAAMTNVDECELKPTLCWDNNVTATRFILDAAKKINSKILFVSTDFIFDGTKERLKENDYPEPVNYYGSSKLAAEKAVIQSGLAFCIVRTCLVFGPESDNRSNIILWIKNNLSNNKKINVVNDQWRTPTDVRDLAKAIYLCFKKDAEGIYHISSDELVTPYDLAKLTSEIYNLNFDLVEKTDSSIFKQPAKRPLKTGFDISKAKTELGFEPTKLSDSIKTI